LPFAERLIMRCLLCIGKLCFLRLEFVRRKFSLFSANAKELDCLGMQYKLDVHKKAVAEVSAAACVVFFV
jgi:hypothetical protein